MRDDRDLIISKLYLEMTCALNINQTGVENVLIVLAAFIGTSEGRPLNVTKLSQATAIPRTTVLRKVKELVSRGVLTEQPRSTYAFNFQSHRNNRVNSHALTKAVIEAAAALSKVDTK